MTAVISASLADVYLTNEVFVRLRDNNALMGKCGRCRFRVLAEMGAQP